MNRIKNSYISLLMLFFLSTLSVKSALADKSYGIGASITDDDLKSPGVTIMGIGENSPAADARLERGDVVLEINNNLINSPFDFEKELSAFGRLGNGIPVMLKIKRTGEAFYVTSYIEVGGMSDLAKAATIGGTSAAVSWFLVTFGGEILCFMGVGPACICVGPLC